MIVDLSTTGPSCKRWQQAIEEDFDAVVDRARGVSAPVEDHLRRCPTCRAYRHDLHRLRAALRSLPDVPLPDDALTEIWDATVDRHPPTTRRAFAAGRIRTALAAAAAIALTTLACIVGTGRAREAELTRIEHDLHVVMATLADTLARTERVTIEDVLVGETTTALQYLPLGQGAQGQTPE